MLAREKCLPALVQSLGQLLLGKSSCASRSLAGTCLVGLANEHQSSPKALTGGRAQVLRVKGAHVVWSLLREVEMGLPLGDWGCEDVEGFS